MSEFTHFSDDRELQIQLAKDLIGSFIGVRSAWIHEEEQKPAPNSAQIATWRDEQGDFFDLRERLAMMNEGEIAEVFKKYRSQQEAESAVQKNSR